MRNNSLILNLDLESQILNSNQTKISLMYSLWERESGPMLF